MQGKRVLFSEKDNHTNYLSFGLFPTRKGADMDKFNISLLLIFMILFVLKNGSQPNS